MPNELLANEVLAPLPEVALSEPDYRAFCAALEASARGRAFLAEYAKRNRHANTEVLLAAIERLEAMVREQTASSAADRIRQELRALLAALQTAQPAIDATVGALKSAKLGAMIGFVQHRIESIVANTPSPLPAEVAALMMPDETPQDTAQGSAHERSHLFVVPASEQPELPIPAPTAMTPAIALVAAPVQAAEPVPEEPQPIALAIAAPEPAITELPAPALSRPTAAVIPEVNLFDPAPVKAVAPAPAAVVEVAEEPQAAPLAAAPTAVPLAIAAVVETLVVQAAPAPAAEAPFEPPPFRIIPADAGVVGDKVDWEDFGTGAPSETPPTQPAAPAQDATDAVAPVVQTPAEDPLALIMALSEAERIALFT